MFLRELVAKYHWRYGRMKLKSWSVAFRILEFCKELGGWVLTKQVYHRFPEHSRASLKERLHELAKEGYLKRTRKGVYRLTKKGLEVLG